MFADLPRGLGIDFGQFCPRVNSDRTKTSVFLLGAIAGIRKSHSVQDFGRRLPFWRLLIGRRVAHAFIREGLSPQKVRRAIEYGAEIVSSEYPFAKARFRTDGKTVILHVLDVEKGDERLIDLFKHGQYLMQKVIEPSLKGLELRMKSQRDGGRSVAQKGS
jgi:hypothetical protein